MSAQSNTLTAEEYFLIALPTDEDFAAWTRGLHAWADDLNARLERKWPHIFGADAKKRKRRQGGELPLDD